MKHTFSYWEQLKSLPLPSLAKTINNYLEWVEPILPLENLKETKRAADSFLKNEGPLLQQRLKRWAEEEHGDWLKNLWDNMYLEIRNPLVINVNYMIKLKTAYLQDKYSASEIAGVVISKLFNIYKEIIQEEFKPEFAGGRPLCMAQYRNLFKAMRIPRPQRDQFIVVPWTDNNYIVVIYKNNMYKMPISNGQGEVLPYKSIVNTLNELMSFDDNSDGVSLGMLTTAPREEAASLLSKILSSEVNQSSFELLQGALWVVCIDEDAEGLHEFAHSLLCSGGDNRYFDKNLQLIFNHKGDLGFNMEHTAVDAGPWIYIFDLIGQELLRIDSYTTAPEADSVQPQRISWDFSDEMKNRLLLIKRNHTGIAADIGMEIFYFQKFGRRRIKESGYSADAFLHAALQIAQFNTFGELKSTYEAVAMRTFRHGRTECCRPITKELSVFVKAFAEAEAGAETGRDKLKILMDKALRKHKTRLKECQSGEAIERHMFGLFNMYKMFGKELSLTETPKLFTDSGYLMLKKDFISTSAMGSEYFDVVGFGPVVEDGFGLCYSILEDKIVLCLTYHKNVSSKKGKELAEEILKSMEQLGVLIFGY